MAFSQMKVQAVILVLVAASLDVATCGSTIIKVPPIKPGEVNQTIVVNIPPTVDVTRTVQMGNDTSERLVLPPLTPPAGGDCLLSDCDENDVGCDGLPPCGPLCPPEACARVNCSQCWRAGFSGPCCWSCCSQYMPYSSPQLPPTAPQQRQQPAFFPYPQSEARPLTQIRPMPMPQMPPINIPFGQPQGIPMPQPQAIPIPQAQAFQIPQPQSIPIPQPQPYPIVQPQPFPIAQPQPIPVPQPQPFPVPQPRPVPFPISVPQPYTVPQPIPYPQLRPQLQVQPQPQYYRPPQCRQVPNWPFLDCTPSSNCGPWYQPGCVSPPYWPNLCYTVGPC